MLNCHPNHSPYDIGCRTRHYSHGKRQETNQERTIVIHLLRKELYLTVKKAKGRISVMRFANRIPLLFE